MRKLINYIRSCFCKHEWELLKDMDVYDTLFDEKGIYPDYHEWIYRCKKCGCANKIKS